MALRREVITGLAASALLPTQSWAAVGSPAVVSAALRPDGQHVLVGLDSSGGLTFEVLLPSRGHAAAAHPTTPELVAMARRPGTFAMVIDCLGGHIKQRISAPDGNHFYGHAAFSQDGRYLFTTENAYQTGDGRIGVWDRSNGYQRVSEFSSGGIGPHEVILLPNGDLAVANGGIRTHPETNREKLNLDTMRSNLTILDPSGAVIDKAFMPEAARLNSLRHLAALPNGTIGYGCQWQGDIYETPSLIGIYRGDSTLRFARMDERVLRSVEGYIGSIASIARKNFVATSPRGNKAIWLDDAGNVLKTFSSNDVCGIASSWQETALMTNGGGSVSRLTADKQSMVAQHELAFDNHLVRLPQ